MDLISDINLKIHTVNENTFINGVPYNFVHTLVLKMTVISADKAVFYQNSIVR